MRLVFRDVSVEGDPDDFNNICCLMCEIIDLVREYRKDSPKLTGHQLRQVLQELPICFQGESWFDAADDADDHLDPEG